MEYENVQLVILLFINLLSSVIVVAICRIVYTGKNPLMITREKIKLCKITTQYQIFITPICKFFLVAYMITVIMVHFTITSGSNLNCIRI